MLNIRTAGFVVDHFTYRVASPSRGKDGLCEECGARFCAGDVVRISPDLNRDGFCHEECNAEGGEPR